MTPETCPSCGDAVHPIDMHDHRSCADCCPCDLGDRLGQLIEHTADLLRPDPFPVGRHTRDKVLALMLELTVLAGDYARIGANDE